MVSCFSNVLGQITSQGRRVLVEDHKVPKTAPYSITFAYKGEREVVVVELTARNDLDMSARNLVVGLLTERNKNNGPVEARHINVLSVKSVRKKKRGKKSMKKAASRRQKA